MVIRDYMDEAGTSPFGHWIDSLDAAAAIKVSSAIRRLRQGGFSQVRGVGSGVFEYKIDFGPGYRIYFGKDGESLIILLGGGSKKRQSEDIRAALGRWQDYKKRKRRKDE